MNAQNLRVKWKQNNALKYGFYLYKTSIYKITLHSLLINSHCVSIAYLLIRLNHWIKSYSWWVMQNERLIKLIVDIAEERTGKHLSRIVHACGDSAEHRGSSSEGWRRERTPFLYCSNYELWNLQCLLRVHLVFKEIGLGYWNLRAFLSRIYTHPELVS